MRMPMPCIGLGVLLLWACSNDRTAGKPVADETTNGIELSIMDPSGKAISNARVVMMPSWSTNGQHADTLHADSKGTLHLDSLPIGTWWFEVSQGSRGARILMEPGFDTTVTLASLGTLAGIAPAFSTVSLYGSTRTSHANAEGSYTFDSLPMGDWTLQVKTPDGVLAQETHAQVRPEQVTSIPWTATLLADWKTWKHHRKFSLQANSESTDSVLHDFLIPLSVENGLELEFQSLRVISELDGVLSMHVEEFDSIQGKATLWVQTNVNPQSGSTFHLVWGKPGLDTNSPAMADSTLYGIWHFATNNSLANSMGSGPAIKKDSLTHTEEGRFAQARFFEGNSGLFLESPNSELSEFTISCWILYHQDPQHDFAKVIHLGWPDYPFGSFMFDIDTTARLPAFQMAFADSTYQRILTKPNPVRDDSIRSGTRWVHLAATWSESLGEAAFYVDGESQGTFKSSIPMLSHLTPTQYDIILGNQIGFLAGFHGVIDEFRFETRHRSHAWIQSLYWTQIGLHIQE